MHILRYNRPAETDYIVDFETYYDSKIGLSVKDQGNLAYVTDPRFYAFMVSITEIGDPCKLIFVGAPEDAPWDKIIDSNWWAWNAGFDKAVYEHGLKFPRPKAPCRWDDAAALAAYKNYPRDLAHAILNFKGVKPDKNVRAAADGKRDRSSFTDEQWQEMLTYCSMDGVHAGDFVYELASDWPDEERDIAMHTVDISHRGFEMNWEAIHAGKIALQRAIIQAEGQMPWVTEYDMKPLSPKGLAIVCREHGIPAPQSLAQDSPALEEWCEKYGDEFDFVRCMQRHRAANNLLKKLDVFEIRRRPDTTRADYGFKYCAAHTGRWGGDNKTNVQALHKDEVEGVYLRHMIVAPKGKRLAIFDFSQIEPRVLAWLAGDTKFLKLLQQGFNPYESHALATMGWTPEDGKKMKESHKELYALAKARVLGLGYGCGKDKFVVVAKSMAGVILTLEESERTVHDYRRSNKPIINFWNKLETVLSRVTMKPKDQRTYEMILPSGRPQTYFNIHTRGGKLFARTERGGYDKPIYGGKLTENVTQAAARDVLRDCLINMANEGYEYPLFHVHDEVIMEVDADFEHDKEAVARLMSVITRTPEWLPGCPIEAELSFSDHYTK